MLRRIINKPFSILCASIALWDGGIWKPDEIYYTAEKALEVGKERIKVVIGLNSKER